METVVGDLSLGNFRLRTFAWYISFGILRSGTSFGNFRLGIFAPERALRNFYLETLAWELSLAHFRLEMTLEHLAWELSFWGTSARELALKKNRLDTFACELWLWLGFFGLRSSAWGTGLLRLGEPLGAGGGKPAGQRAATGL